MNRPVKSEPYLEPRWHGYVALLAVGLLRLALPPSLSVGPDWLLFLVLVLLIVPKFISIRHGKHQIERILGHIASGMATADMIASLALLISRLPAHAETPKQLLTAASFLWVTNVLVFASWYWRLDAGGPLGRDAQAAKAGGFHADGAFLFPQMTMLPDLRKQMGEERWRPGFVDYLFLAFNTSTAFSPTDVPILSRWAKGLMMVQASIALATIAIIAARAVNIL